MKDYRLYRIMRTERQQCERQLLQRSLDDGLSGDEEEWLAVHLTQCESCRRQLDQLAADSDDWDSVEHALREEAQQQTVTSVEQEPSAADPLDFAVTFLGPSDREDAIGRLGEIHILAVIGQGGNGVVLKGFQPELNRLVAVKVMAPHLAASAAARQRFGREAQAAAAIVHPSVMPILSVNSAGQLPYLVMPCVDCETLQQRLEREGALPILDVLRIGHQVAGGLAAAHAQGLIHRDVKPANILLERGVDRVLLTDFGLARAVDDASLTRSGLIAGTPQYMSPEQARGESLDVRSDLFSLGSVLYCMSTGRPPFRAETSYGILRRVTDEQPRPVRDVNPAMPAWFEHVIFRAMAKNPEQRYSSASEMESLLRECLAHQQHPSAHPRPLIIQNQPWPKRLVLSLSAVVTVLLLAAILAVAMFWPGQDSRTGPSQNETGGISGFSTGGQSQGEEVPEDALWPDDLDTEMSLIRDRLETLESSVIQWHQQPFPDESNELPENVAPETEVQ